MRRSLLPFSPSTFRTATSLMRSMGVVSVVPERRPGVAALSRPRLD